MTTKTYPDRFVTDLCNVLCRVYGGANHFAGFYSKAHGHGICHLVEMESDLDPDIPDFVCDAIVTWVRETIARWPDHSGDRDYPVPAPAGYVSDSEYHVNVHEDAFFSLHKWDRITEYGRSRWSLLAFLLEEASKMKVQ